MSNPAELRSGQERRRGQGIPELRSGAICGMYENAANLHIGQQAVGMSTPTEQKEKRLLYIYMYG